VTKSQPLLNGAAFLASLGAVYVPGGVLLGILYQYLPIFTS
jgi:hypothetical protein